MKFNPKTHTKEFFLRHPDYLEEIIKTDPDFLDEPLASDFELLKKKVNKNFDETAAHVFALHQNNWVHSDSAKNYDVLKLQNKYKRSVAHVLASKHPEWVSSDAARDYEILLLKTDNNWTVALNLAEMCPAWVHSEAAQDYSILTHTSRGQKYTVAHALAHSQKEWMKSKASHDFKILTLKDNAGESVALNLIEHTECLQHEPLFDKRILSLKANGKTLAEDLIQKHCSQELMPQVAMKLISKGIAYKQQNFISTGVGQAIYDQTLELIDACTDDNVSFKYLAALYSTFSHYASNFQNNDDKENIDYFESLLNRASGLIKDQIDAQPHLLNSEKKFDLFCEPAQHLLVQLMNERIFRHSLDNSQHQEHEPQSPEVDEIKLY
jgi:hypothetical protein